jgi:uroporphyrinogen-III synthase
VTETDSPGGQPLAGYTVAVTAERRREELGALLERRGARVVHAPAIRIVPLADDADLVAATREVLARPVDLVVATTGVGFRGWLEAAGAWDLPLVEHLGTARVLARGPKARGAIRGGGLLDAWSPESESSAEVLSHLLSGAEGPLAGRRIVVQLHGDPLPDLVTGLRQNGAEVLTVPVYRWVLPEDVAPVHRLVAGIADGGIDAVTFTSAPAVVGLLTVAGQDGRRAELVAALRNRVTAFAVGPVTAGPLDAEGIPSFQPERARLGPLAREVVARLPERDPVLAVGAHTLQVRGHGALLDGRLVELAPALMAALRELARFPGDVVPISVPVAAELRAALAPLVEPVVERGHRLRI